MNFDKPDFRMKYPSIASICDKLLKIDLSKFYLIDKHLLSKACLYAGMLILYFGSLHPWFMWPLKELYPIPAALLLAISYLVNNSMENTPPTKKDYWGGVMGYILISYYIIITGSQNFNAYIVNVFSIFSIYILLRQDVHSLGEMATFIAKAFALLLTISMAFFVLYIFGFNMPFVNASFGDYQYTYSNYYFFMIDDRTLSVLIPRFQSVFLEPGHLGSATTVLLMTQIGKWKRWWNVVLIIASVISFSLAAYAILISLMFLRLWVLRRNLVGKLVITLSLISVVCIGATFYNQGDNLINNLILSRLEIDDQTGTFVGNNRVDKDFEKEFDKYIVTSDAFFGRDMSKAATGAGNSGYRVFIYQNGLVGLFLVVLFYALSFKGYNDTRYMLTAVFISLLIFWIRGYPLWYSNYIPIYITVFLTYIADDDIIKERIS